MSYDCNNLPVRSTMGKYMFKHFTETAIKVVMLAEEESRRAGHNYIGTEQILVAAVWEKLSIASKVLQSLGFSLRDLRGEVEKTIGYGSGYVAVEIPLTPPAKQVISAAKEAARQLGHNYVGTQHLLLGLIDNPENTACKVLINLGIDLGKIRDLSMEIADEDTIVAGERPTAGQSLEFRSNINDRMEEVDRIIALLQRKLGIINDDFSADNSP
jgi:ATP-dependent Clp protease ATP-binding subunit ClpC